MGKLVLLGIGKDEAGLLGLETPCGAGTGNEREAGGAEEKFHPPPPLLLLASGCAACCEEAEGGRPETQGKAGLAGGGCNGIGSELAGSW